MAAKLGFELVKQAMLKLLMKKGDDGILLTLPKNEIVDYNAKITMDRLIRNGIDPDSLTSPDQVINVLDNINNQIMNKARVIPATSAEGKAITEKLFGKKGEVISFKDKIEAMKKSGDIVDPDNLKVSEKVTEREMFKNSNLNKKDSVTETVSYIKTLEPMDAMKEANSVIGRKGKYKNLTPEESKKILTDTEDHIFERDIPIDPEDMATGGRAGFANGNGVDDELVIVEAYGPEGRKLEKTTRSHAIKYGLTIVDDETKDSGRAGLYTGGIVDVEPSLDDIGHGSDALMARTRLVSPGNQATTSTGLNYLLAEDNDNMRVPFADGKSFSESELLEFNKAIKEKIKKGGRSNMPVIDPEEYKKYLESFKTTEAAEGGRIPFGGGGSYDYGSMQYKIDAVNAAYRRYKKGSQTSGRGGKMTFEQFAPIWAKENFATGGRAGFAKGKIAKEVLDKGRRGFMKTAGAVGAGITALKTGLLGFGKEAAPVVEKTVEAVSNTAGQVPPYFFKLVEKIKTLGDDTLATQDKTIAKKYKDYVMEEDFAGNITIIKKGDDVAEDVYMSLKVDEVPVKGKKGSTKVEEYEEFTARPDAEGKMKDIEPGVPDEIIKEVGEGSGNVPESFYTGPNAIKKADGGRIGLFMGGGLTAGKGLLKNMLKFMSKDGSHKKSPAEILKMMNPKQYEKLLNNPKYQGQVSSEAPEGLDKIIQDMIGKTKTDRSDMVGDIISTSRKIKKTDDDIIDYKNKIIKDLMDRGSDRETAEQFAETLALQVSKAAGKKSTPEITEQGLLELENIQKNLVTKDRKLQATGGLTTMLGE